MLFVKRTKGRGKKNAWLYLGFLKQPKVCDKNKKLKRPTIREKVSSIIVKAPIFL
jgi:hypothetical protein